MRAETAPARAFLSPLSLSLSLSLSLCLCLSLSLSHSLSLSLSLSVSPSLGGAAAPSCNTLCPTSRIELRSTSSCGESASSL